VGSSFIGFFLPRITMQKRRVFFSRFWNPGTAGIDAFFQSWEGENCLAVPPVLGSLATLDCKMLLSLWWSLHGPPLASGRYYGNFILR